jgi:predicted  nucleic acid-binding Zn-ribbon protein
MKKGFICSAVLLFALTTALFAGRKEIDDLYKAYEAFVVETENLAKKPSVSLNDFSTLTEKAETMEKKGEAVKDDKAFTVQDSQRFAALDARFQTAWQTVMQKLKY